MGGSFTSDGTFTDMSIQVVYRGADELGKTADEFAKAFPDMHREIFQVYTVDNIVVVQLRYRAHTSGHCTCPQGFFRRLASGWTPHAATSLNWSATR